MNIPQISKKTFYTSQKDYPVYSKTVQNLLKLDEYKTVENSKKPFLKNILMLKVKNFYKNEENTINSILQNNKKEILSLKENYLSKVKLLVENFKDNETFYKDFQKIEKEVSESFLEILTNGYQLKNVKPSVNVVKINKNNAAEWKLIGGQIRLSDEIETARFDELIPSLVHEFTHMKQDLNTLQSKGPSAIMDMMFFTKKMKNYFAKNTVTQSDLEHTFKTLILDSPFMVNLLKFAKEHPIKKTSIENKLGKTNLKEYCNYIEYNDNPKGYLNQIREMHAYFVENKASGALKQISKN